MFSSAPITSAYGTATTALSASDVVSKSVSFSISSLIALYDIFAIDANANGAPTIGTALVSIEGNDAATPTNACSKNPKFCFDSSVVKSEPKVSIIALLLAAIAFFCTLLINTFFICSSLNPLSL